MAWNDTLEGLELDAAWETLRAAYNQTLPGHVDSLRRAASRPIEG